MTPEIDQKALEAAWTELVEKDDRTSPEEYPDMALITRDELAAFMLAATTSNAAETAEPVPPDAFTDLLTEWETAIEEAATITIEDFGTARSQGFDIKRPADELRMFFRSLRAFLDPAPQPLSTSSGEDRAPDHCYDPKNWEVTFEWSDRDMLVDGMPLGDVMEIATLHDGAPRWAAHVVQTWHEGEPDETEVVFFATEEEARAAIRKLSEKPEAPHHG